MYSFCSEEYNTFFISSLVENLILVEQQIYWKGVIISPLEFLSHNINK